MTYFRDYSPKRDANEAEVMEPFQAVGWFIVKANDIDLFINDEWGDWFAVEAKMPGGRMLKHQTHIQVRCGNCYVSRSRVDSLAIIQDRRERHARRWATHVPIH